MADAAQLAAGELAIEVGPGTGTLTEELLRRGASVLAVEIDRDLAEALRQRFAHEPALRLIEGDALGGKHQLNPLLLEQVRLARQGGTAVKLAANLPYNIASPLIIELLIAGVSLLAFTVQKEVADRLKATPGSKDYGTLSIMTQLLADVEVLRTLPPQAFWPAPKIESALLRMERRGGSLSALGEERIREFGGFVRSLFSARRKTMRKALAQMGVDAERALAAASVDPQVRPEDVGAEKMLELFVGLGSM